MLVLHVLSSIDPASGGPAHALVGLATAQKRQGGDVLVLASSRASADSSYIEQLEAADVEVRTVGPCTGPLCRHPEMGRFVAAAVNQSSVVHIHGLWEQIQHEAATGARKQGKPFIFRPCGMLDPWSLSQRWLKKRVYMAWRLRRNLNSAAVLHFTSATEHRLTHPLRLRAPAVIESNGVDLSEFAMMPDSGRFRRELPKIGDRPMVLFLSRLHGKKGLDLLIPAFASLEDKNAVLVLAGPDDRGYRVEVEALIAKHGIGDRVTLTGMIKGQQKLAALADADVFVLPSYQENFGIAVVEALAAGTPVIVSDQVNIHDEINKAGVGAVVPTQVESLAKTLDRWLKDEQLRSAAASRTREFVKHNYDWNEIAARWMQRYELIAAGRQPADVING